MLPELIRDIAAAKSDRVALVVDGAGRHTYRELAERAAAVSAGLQARGVGRGDLIALLFSSASWLDYTSALLGVLTAGATAVVVSGGPAEEELRSVAVQCELRAVVTDRPRGLPDVANWHCDLAAVETSDAPGWPAVDNHPGDLAMMLYTSGTAGSPKGVPLTHARLAALTSHVADSERVIAAFPIASAAGQLLLAKELGSANTLHLMPEFDADRLSALVRSERIQRVHLAPAMGRWLTQIDAVQRSKLRVMFSEPDSMRESRSSTELYLAHMWRHLLGLDEIPGGQSNFFDLGGHSLVAAQLMDMTENAFGVTPTVQDLLYHATLAEQAAYLDTLYRETLASGRLRYQSTMSRTPSRVEIRGDQPRTLCARPIDGQRRDGSSSGRTL